MITFLGLSKAHIYKIYTLKLLSIIALVMDPYLSYSENKQRKEVQVTNVNS